MQMDGIATTLDELAAETGWLRRLALSLVKDPAAADDLVQDTYVIAAERAPVDGRPLRPWLVRVLVNLTRMRGRGEARRSAREHAVAGLATAPATPAELVGRVEVHRMLAGLVLELAPPARDIVLLHYFEGLSTTAIATRLGIPGGTVRWRLSQALDELRRRLEQREPNRAWIASLAAFGAPARRTGAAAVPWLVVAALALVLATAWILVHARPSVDEATAARPAAHRAVGPGPGAPHEAPHEDAPPSRTAARIAVPAATPGRMHMSGRVIDPQDRPVEAADVTANCGYEDDAPWPHTRTTADGDFALDVGTDCWGSVIASKDGLAAGQPILRSPLPDGLTLQLQPRPVVAVHVVERDGGAPIAGAEVAASSSVQRHRGAADHVESATTDADGNARVHVLAPDRMLWSLPAATANQLLVVRITARAAQHIVAATELQDLAELRGTAPIQRTLQLASGTPIQGQLVGPDGKPVGDAAIDVVGPLGPEFRSSMNERAAGTRVRTDAAGRFEATVPAPGRYQLTPLGPSLVAIRDDETNREVAAGGLTGVVIHLMPATAGGVAGIVVDVTGTPVAGAQVSATNNKVAPMVTDAQGRFAIASAGRYALYPLVARHGTLASEVTSVEVPRGERRGVTLTLGPAGIAGVVVDPQGATIAGAEVWLNGYGSVPGHRVIADAQGRFALDVPRGDFVLSVRRSDEDDFLAEDDRHVAGGTHDVRLVVP